MPKHGTEGTKLVETRTRERIAVQEGDALQGRLRSAMGQVTKLALEGYVAALWSLEEIEMKLVVFKLVGTHYNKKGEIVYREMDPAEIEPYLINTWGTGRYQVRPLMEGRFYTPTSPVYAVGEEDDSAKPPAPADVDGAIADAAHRLGNVGALAKMQEVLRPQAPPTGGLDIQGLAALMGALKPDNSLLVASLDAANRRAEAAEQRNHELTIKMMDGRSGAAQGMGPVLGELFKHMKGEHLTALLNPTTPETDWLGTIRDLVRDFAPALQMMLLKAMESAGLPGAAQRALPAPGTDIMSAPAPANPTPAPSLEGGPMPIPLNEEQTFAKTLLLDFIKSGDMNNAFAQLEAFPMLVGGVAGPVPFGQTIIMGIDPKVSPKVYLGQLMSILPELKHMLPQAEAFIKDIQRRILADDEAAAREGSGISRGGPDDLKPTGHGGGT